MPIHDYLTFKSSLKNLIMQITVTAAHFNTRLFVSTSSIFSAGYRSTMLPWKECPGDSQVEVNLTAPEEHLLFPIAGTQDSKKSHQKETAGRTAGQERTGQTWTLTEPARPRLSAVKLQPHSQLCRKPKNAQRLGRPRRVLRY